MDENIDQNEEQFDEYQYELSAEMAYSFIDEELLPTLEEFDFNNEEEDYIPGVGAFALYTRLVGILIMDGFTADELKAIIDDFSEVCIDGPIH